MAAPWATHDRLARELLPRHGGREIDKTDGRLLMFGQAADAWRYAQACQQACQQAGQQAGQQALATPGPPLQARTGLHAGPLILRENAPDDVARGARPLGIFEAGEPAPATPPAGDKGCHVLRAGERCQPARLLLVADDREPLVEAAAALAHALLLRPARRWRRTGPRTAPS